MLSRREKYLLTTLGLVLILCGLSILQGNGQLTMTIDTSTLFGLVVLLAVFLLLYHMLHRHAVIEHTPLFQSGAMPSQSVQEFEFIAAEPNGVSASSVVVGVPPIKRSAPTVVPKKATKPSTKRRRVVKKTTATTKKKPSKKR